MNIREWPKNDETLESSLMFPLPEELGIIKNVRVHIKLDDGTYVKIDAIYQCSIEGQLPTPDIFKENTNEKIEIINNRFAVFGMVYQVQNESFLNGTFCITFKAWKDENLTSYYTKEKKFNI